MRVRSKQESRFSKSRFFSKNYPDGEEIRMLYRIAKILNHNSFMGIQDENNQECLVMGKGVAFGKKVGQTVPVTAEAKVYSLKEMTDPVSASDLLSSLPARFLPVPQIPHHSVLQYRFPHESED